MGYLLHIMQGGVPSAISPCLRRYIGLVDVELRYLAAVRGLVRPELPYPIAFVELFADPFVIHQSYQVVREEKAFERERIQLEIGARVFLQHCLAVIPFGLRERPRYEALVPPVLVREVSGQKLLVLQEKGCRVVEREFVPGLVVAMAVPYVHDIQRFLWGQVNDASNHLAIETVLQRGDVGWLPHEQRTLFPVQLKPYHINHLERNIRMRYNYPERYKARFQITFN